MRLFGMADRARELRKKLVARPQDVQGEPELARDLRRARRLVELGAVEADREGVGRPVLPFGHGPGDRGGVDAAGEVQTDRNVGAEPERHRVAEERAELVGTRAVPRPLLADA